MLFHKPHTALVYLPAAQEDGQEITGYTFGSALPPQMVAGPDSTVDGQLTEKTPEAVARDWGLESTNPALFMCDLEDGSTFEIGARIEVGTSVYYVKAGPKNMDAESVTSHSQILLERKP